MNIESSFLRIGLGILLLILILFTVINYSTLSANEGWGVVGVVGIGGWTLAGFLLDLIIGNVFRKQRLKLILRVLVLLAYAFIYFSFFFH